MTDFGFTCSCCQEWHTGLPDLSFRAPFYWNDDAGAGDSVMRYLDSDLCVINEHRFIRCILLVPIRGSGARLGWGVWVTQSQENFGFYEQCFEAPPERVTFGYLSNRLPLYPDTLSMPVQTHWTNDGKRPWVEPEPSEHRLYLDWRDGVSRERAVEWAELALHPQADDDDRAE